MFDALANFLTQEADFVQHCVRVLTGILLSAFGLIIPLAIAAFLFDKLIAPLRLKERTRLFVELLETSLQQGRSAEHTITSLSEMREKAFGVHFHLVAAHLQSGLSLAAALEQTRAFVTPEVCAMLKAGEEIGDVRKVLPACRHTLEQGTSKTQTALNTSIVVIFVAPISSVILWVLTVWVFPRLKSIAIDFLGTVPPSVDLLFRLSSGLGLLLSASWLLMVIFGMGQKGGTGLWARLLARAWPLTHRLNFWIPWRKRRMQRDFSAMLAILLDSGVPEAKAIELAAKCTANHVFIAHSRRVISALREGVKLSDAVQWLDDEGEFKWRLQNASDPQSGFQASLAGWHESLEAKAFQQEQTFSQLVTTSFVFLNGLMVALAAIGVFLVLLSITEEAPLW